MGVTDNTLLVLVISWDLLKKKNDGRRRQKHRHFQTLSLKKNFHAHMHFSMIDLVIRKANEMLMSSFLIVDNAVMEATCNKSDDLHNVCTLWFLQYILCIIIKTQCGGKAHHSVLLRDCKHYPSVL